MTPLEKLQRYLDEGRKLREAALKVVQVAPNVRHPGFVEMSRTLHTFEVDARTRVAVLEEACRVMAEALEVLRHLEVHYGAHGGVFDPKLGDFDRKTLWEGHLSVSEVLDRVAAMLPEGEVK